MTCRMSYMLSPCVAFKAGFNYFVLNMSSLLFKMISSSCFAAATKSTTKRKNATKGVDTKPQVCNMSGRANLLPILATHFPFTLSRPTQLWEVAQPTRPKHLLASPYCKDSTYNAYGPTYSRCGS